MKRILLIIISILSSQLSFSQEDGLFRTWYLTELNVDGTTLTTTDYYPTLNILFFENSEGATLSIPFTDGTCTFLIGDFQEDPNSFSMPDPDPICLLKENCNSGPGTPCVITHDLHAEVFNNLPNSFLYTLTDNGDDTFSLVIENTNGDTATYSSVLLNTNNFSFDSLSLYPNPAKNVLIIQNTQNINITELIIYSIQGQAVYQETPKSNALDVSSLASGIYFVKINTNSGFVTKKFIKR